MPDSPRVASKDSPSQSPGPTWNLLQEEHRASKHSACSARPYLSPACRPANPAELCGDLTASLKWASSHLIFLALDGSPEATSQGQRTTSTS